MKYILGFPQKTLFVFFALLVFSIGFFVSADSVTSNRSIFLDADQDGLSDDEEKVFGTDPLKKDTDGDSYSDGVEVQSGYDPLKPAPGDKLTNENDLGKGGYDSSADMATPNLTETASNEVANILSQVSKDDPSVSMSDLNASIETLLKQSDVEVVIPEVDINTIKIKKIKCKASEGDDKCETKKKDATLEYLTVLAYLVANNSPVPLKTNANLESVSTSFLNDATLALSTGNFALLKDMSTRGETFLSAIKDVEVPENMLEIHIKALKLGLFAQNLGKEFEKKNNDPIAQIALLSQVQGTLGVVADLSNDMMNELAKLGIDTVPVNL